MNRPRRSALPIMPAFRRSKWSENIAVGHRTLGASISLPEMARRFGPGQFPMMRLAGYEDPMLGRLAPLRYRARRYIANQTRLTAPARPADGHRRRLSRHGQNDFRGWHDFVPATRSRCWGRSATVFPPNPSTISSLSAAASGMEGLSASFDRLGLPAPRNTQHAEQELNSDRGYPYRGAEVRKVDQLFPPARLLRQSTALSRYCLHLQHRGPRDRSAHEVRSN